MRIHHNFTIVIEKEVEKIEYSAHRQIQLQLVQGEKKKKQHSS